MATATPPHSSTPPAFETVADLLDRLGGVPASRVLLHPVPGTATEEDLIRVNDRGERLSELVDGVLVEKAMGFDESRLAAYLVFFLIEFLNRHALGTVVGPDAPMRLLPGLVRLPDVAFISWARYPKGEKGPIKAVVPDLVVEVLSRSNTPKEMARKLDEFFRAGVRLAWYVDPKPRTVRVYTGPACPVTLTEDDTLDGGDVLPGFRLPIRDWFAAAEHTGPR